MMISAPRSLYSLLTTAQQHLATAAVVAVGLIPRSQNINVPRCE